MFWLGFLSEEDFVDESRTEGNVPEVIAAAASAAEEEGGPDPGGSRGVEPGEEEDAGKKTATRVKKTGSRRRTHVVTVEDGSLLCIDKGPKQNGRALS